MLFCLKPNLTDKIMIVNMFLLSQLVYIASIAKPETQHIVEIENLILSFLYTGQRTFSKEKTFTSKVKGGLGIPNIKSFSKQ